MKFTIRFLIWLVTLNLLMNFIFPEPVELWKFLLIETCLGFLSFIMVDWKEDKRGKHEICCYFNFNWSIILAICTIHVSKLY